MPPSGALGLTLVVQARVGPVRAGRAAPGKPIGNGSIRRRMEAHERSGVLLRASRTQRGELESELVKFTAPPAPTSSHCGSGRTFHLDVRGHPLLWVISYGRRARDRARSHERECGRLVRVPPVEPRRPPRALDLARVRHLIRLGATVALVVQRGVVRNPNACAPRCRPTVKRGDDAKYFSEVSAQAKDHKPHATGVQ